LLINNKNENIYFNHLAQKEKEKENQRQVIRCEFGPVSPSMVKNPLGARWGLTVDP